MEAHKLSLSIVGNNDVIRINPSPSSWKKIEEFSPRIVRDGVAINGFVYWLISEQDRNRFPMIDIRDQNELIVCLDIEREKFGIINSPSSLSFWVSHPNTRIEFIKTLYLTDEDAMRRTGIFETWAWKLKEKSCTFSWGWMKEHAIKLDFPVITDFSPTIVSPKSSREEELLIRLNGDDRTYYLYNPDENRFRIVDKPPRTDSRGSYAVSLSFYWESGLSFETCT
ncbi:OLC1v1034345C1 [Oldenlandia corymbosa var. corymbosa]|uniref:OLC1v1034345C1 n=1 Tax=Oldenlandia corymbosa var. corymbosa TaxID=529605 RepID=A0AAV1CR43_OLDCO|nr:OLC1v1034345C1 [Oldenlandia corymbosa var. corymbosa]